MWISRMFGYLKKAIVEDVPPEIHACEFCRKVDCTPDNVATCQDRLEGVESARYPTLTLRRPGERPTPSHSDQTQTGTRRSSPLGTAPADTDALDSGPPSGFRSPRERLGSRPEGGWADLD